MGTVGGRRALLVQRLDALAAVLAGRPQALALLALGSGADLSRLDDHSDLDFFLIVAPDAVEGFIANLDWLAVPSPLVWRHRNTPDGWKALSDDGVFYEFAVFDAARLAIIPFAPGRVLWARDGFDTGRLAPRAHPDPEDRAWLVAEILGVLHVGLSRAARGEHLAAWRAIQGEALSMALRVIGGGDDAFNPARRIEVVRPDLAPVLADLASGYGESVRAAWAVLELLGPWMAPHQPMVARIEAQLSGMA